MFTLDWQGSCHHGSKFGHRSCDSAGVCGYGARLALADVDIDGGHETERMVKELGAEVFFAPTNVGDEGDVATLIELTEQTYGRLDVAFNNAGVEGIMVPTTDVTVQDWDRTIADQPQGVWLCMRPRSRRCSAAVEGRS